MGFRKDAERERDRLNRRLQAVREKIAGMPEGDFACYVNGGGFKWFRITACSEEAAVRGRRRTDESDGEPKGSTAARGRKVGRESAEQADGQVDMTAPRGRKESYSDGRKPGSVAVHGKHVYEYIPQSQTELAGALALKRYWKSREQDLQNEIDGLDIYLKKVRRGCGHAQKELANPGMAELVRPQITRRNEMVEVWLQEEYQHNTDHPENLKVPTIGGFMVRSKSEALIADLLIDYKLPFRYECAVIFGGHVRYPDFMILNPVNGQIVIWEHFGMMGSLTYQSEYAGKIGNYVANGYIPYQNLITTFETKEQPFDVAAAERVVKIMFGEYLDSLDRE